MPNFIELIGALTPLAWPTVAIIALFLLRAPLVEALRRLLRLDLETKKWKLAATLSDQMDAEVAKQIARGEVGNISPQVSVVSIMILELRTLTSWAEGRDAAGAQLAVNSIQSRVAEVVRNANGVIDSWSPDSLVACWNAPVPQPDHARKALECAIATQSALIDLREVSKEGEIPRSHAIVSTFDAPLGLVGPGASKAFRVLANIDEKIGGLRAFARTFNLDVLVTAFTYDLLEDKQGLNLLGKARVKGKQEPINVYAVQLPGGADVGEARREFQKLAEAAGDDVFPLELK